MTFILFFKLDFSLVGGTRKGVYKAKLEWILQIRCLKIYLRGGESIDYVKSENYFENYGHKIGDISHIELDKPNPVYMVGSCCT